MLTVIDEFTRRCMAVVVERRLNSDNVLHCLTELFVQHGPPDHIRSDNGSEFTAHAVRDWLGRIGVKTLYIEPGSPWENGYNESFNSNQVPLTILLLSHRHQRTPLQARTPENQTMPTSSREDFVNGLLSQIATAGWRFAQAAI